MIEETKSAQECMRDESEEPTNFSTGQSMIDESQESHIFPNIDQNKGVVEIDEGLFGHYTDQEGTKYQVWMFGMGDRVTEEGRAFLVKPRDSKMLIPIIQQC